MSRILCRLILWGVLFGSAWGGLASAAFYPAPQGDVHHLTILSATDEVWMRALILDFQQLYPDVAVEYRDMESLPLFNAFLRDYQNGVTADLVISSAMDLQVKLVNDGYAATHDSQALGWLPDWASWRGQAFAFTAEPAVMVYNNRLLLPEQAPRDRFELLSLLRAEGGRFQHKVGTYDVYLSGLGYLFASQDAQQASTWGRLSETLSRVQARLYGNTSGMLQALVKGELLISYNVLGSYAQSWVDQHPELSIVLPSDYTLLMSRVAFVSKRAANPEAGHRFLEHLLSLRGQGLLARESRLYPIHPEVQGAHSYAGIQALAQGKVPLKLIELGPALLTYQDRLKKARFLRDWANLMQPISSIRE